jgi:hypothetical protein
VTVQERGANEDRNEGVNEEVMVLGSWNSGTKMTLSEIRVMEYKQLNTLRNLSTVSHRTDTYTSVSR